MNLTDLANSIHEANKSKGFWDDGYTTKEYSQKLLLVHAEVSEASEELRKPILDLQKIPTEGKPDGFAIELADILIRVLDLSAACKIDIEKAVQVKLEYNKTRPYRHNKRF